MVDVGKEVQKSVKELSEKTVYSLFEFKSLVNENFPTPAQCDVKISKDEIKINFKPLLRIKKDMYCVVKNEQDRVSRPRM